jgi:PAS domain S-box-containing protein
MDISLRVLILGDSREDVESLLVELCRGGYEVSCERVDTAEGMTNALSETEWDVVIAAYNLPNFSAPAALDLLQKSGFELPFITLSDGVDEDLAVKTMKAGAKDYILKENLRRLVPVVERELRESQVRRERKKMEKELQQSEYRFLQLAENITEVFWMSSTDESGMLYISPAYEKIWGRNYKSLYELPTTWLDAIHPDDRDRIERAVMTHQLLWIQHGVGSYDEEFRIIRPDGSVRWIRDRAFPIKDESGRICRITGIAEDITECKQAEREREALLAREQKARLEAQEANRLKDEFLTIISDELRIPLNANYGWAQLLGMGGLDPERQQIVLEALEQNARAREHLIRALLDVSHMIAGKLRLDLCPLSLVPIIKAAVETVRQAAEAKRIEVKMTLDPSINPVMIDPERLQQVLGNLLSNAIKFTPDNGRIEIFLEQVDPYIQIRVKDYGMGIPSDFLPYMFNRFRRAEGSTKRSQKGLGLGLAIVKHLVELHGGSVLAESPGEGKGATVTVRLPIRDVQRKEDDSEPGRSPAKQEESFGSLPALYNWNLLLVDDEVDVRTLLKIALEGYGIHVTAAASAQEALEILERKRLDLLISDIRMPMDGYVLLEKVREWERQRGISKIPVIALTAFAREDEHERALSAGFQAYLPKQAKPDELITVIAKVINQFTETAS